MKQNPDAFSVISGQFSLLIIHTHLCNCSPLCALIPLVLGAPRQALKESQVDALERPVFSPGSQSRVLSILQERIGYGVLELPREMCRNSVRASSLKPANSLTARLRKAMSPLAQARSLPFSKLERRP
jgi:hypothetical protein